MAKRRAAYFSEAEQQVLFEAYEEERAIITKKSNTCASAKERDLAWQRITDRVNACNSTALKRTWLQVKMKYKNIVQVANRKKAEERKTGSGPAVSPLTPVEELAISILGRPMMEGIPGGTSSEPSTSQEEQNELVQVEGGVLLLVEPPPTTTTNDTAPTAEDEETLSAVTEEPPMSAETVAAVEDPAPSRPNEYKNMSARELYRVYLQRQIAKADLEMEYLKLKIEAMKHAMGK